eukprot:Em0012g404a
MDASLEKLMECSTSPTLGIWDHMSGADGPQCCRFASAPASNKDVSGPGVGKVSGYSMVVTKRIKSSIRAEWAHQPTRSIQPQPPPNGHLVLIRLQVCAWIQATSVTLMAEHIAKHCLTSSSKELRASETRLGGVTLATWTILQKLLHMRNRVTATWRSTAATSTRPDSSLQDSAHFPAINIEQCRLEADPAKRMSQQRMGPIAPQHPRSIYWGICECLNAATFIQ